MLDDKHMLHVSRPSIEWIGRSSVKQRILFVNGHCSAAFEWFKFSYFKFSVIICICLCSASLHVFVLTAIF